MSRPPDASRSTPARSTYAGILLCSLAVLMLEVLLTRVFSFTIWYHLAYLTISTALLGFGAAGSLLAAFPGLLAGDPRRLAARCSAGAGASLLLAMWLLAPRPIDPARLLVEPGRFFLGLLGSYALVTLPFLLAGVAVAAPLAAHPGRVDRLYAADLAGAGLGCLAAVGAISWLDGVGALTVAAALLVAAGAVYAPSGRFAAGLGVAAGALLLAAPLAGRVVELRPAASKALARSLAQPGSELLYTRWNAVSRVDLYRGAAPRLSFWAGYGRSARYRGEVPAALSLQYDGHNGSSAFEVRGPDSLRMLDTHLLRTPYLPRQRPRVLVIGVGGGVDVLNALRRGASRVTAIELQPITVELLRGRLAEWTGRAFLRPEVELVAAEGRHYVSSHGGIYDLVQITATDTFSAQSAGAYVLAESYLYTVEAFETYLDRLDDDGVLSLVLADFLYRDASLALPLVTRLALTAREALSRRGVADPAAHLLRVGQTKPADTPDAGVMGAALSNLLVKKTPFTPAEIGRIRAFAAANGFELTLVPGETAGSPLATLVNAPAGALERALGEQPFALRPVTDDRPFFYHVLPWRGLFRGVAVFWELPGSSTGQIVLLMMLGQALLLGGALILLPLRRIDRSGLTRRQTTAFLLYFLSLGLGFLLIEISFVQKYVLLLGYPTYSLSVTIFSLLLFAALGAWLSRRGFGRPRRFLIRLLAATLACVALELLLLPWVRAGLLAAPLAARVAATSLLQLPLGLCLGMYFPFGIELLRRFAPALVPWAWGVNGVASVASAVLAVMLAMSFGFSAVALVASLVYAIGTLALLGILPALEAAGSPSLEVPELAEPGPQLG
jgi:hypothetical protein